MKQMIPLTLIVLFIGLTIFTSGCAVTKGTRTQTHIKNPTLLDSTVVLVVRENYEETTTYPWAIALGIVGAIATVLVTSKK